MKTARQAATELLRELEFPTEWTMVDDEVKWPEEPQLAKAKNEEMDTGEEIETPLVAHA